MCQILRPHEQPQRVTSDGLNWYVEAGATLRCQKHQGQPLTLLVESSGTLAPRKLTWEADQDREGAILAGAAPAFEVAVNQARRQTADDVSCGHCHVRFKNPSRSRVWRGRQEVRCWAHWEAIRPRRTPTRPCPIENRLGQQLGARWGVPASRSMERGSGSATTPRDHVMCIQPCACRGTRRHRSSIGYGARSQDKEQEWRAGCSCKPALQAEAKKLAIHWLDTRSHGQELAQGLSGADSWQVDRLQGRRSPRTNYNESVSTPVFGPGTRTPLNPSF